LVGYLPAGAGGVATTVQNKERQIISTFDFMTDAQKVDVQASALTLDCTAAVQAAFDAWVSLGNASQHGVTLEIPYGDCKVTALTLGYITGGSGTSATKDVYHKNIICKGKLVGTNAAGAVLNIEGMVANNIQFLRVHNTSKAAGSLSVKAKRSYAVNWIGCKFTGGEKAHQLQGNNNNYIGCGFTDSGTGFYIGTDTADCVNNTLYGCDLETNDFYGVNLDRSSGTLPSLNIKECYFESNVIGYLGDIRIKNSTSVFIEKNYFAIGISHDCVLFSGTTSPATASAMYSTIKDNKFNFTATSLSCNCIALESGTASTAMRYATYSNNELIGNTNSNTVLGVLGGYAGSANAGYTYGINKDGLRRNVNIQNSDFSSLSGGAGTAPNIWASSGGTAPVTGVTISPYGGGNKVSKADGYERQTILARAKTLYHLSSWAQVTAGTQVAQLDLWNAGVSSNLVRASTSATVPTFIEAWYYNDAHTNGTAAGATTNATGYAIGVTTILQAAAGTGTILAGDTVQFAGDTNRYRVKTGNANVAVGGNIVLLDPLQVAIPAAATAITIVTDSTLNTLEILLRAGGSAGNIEFSEVKMVDLTN
jgi:hypothetical protein